MEWAGRRPQPRDHVLASEAGAPWRPRSSDAIRALLRAADCDDKYAGKPIDFHATRRSFATWLARAGVERAVRKILMGHIEGDVTEEHYIERDLAMLPRGSVPHPPRPQCEGQGPRVPACQGDGRRRKLNRDIVRPKMIAPKYEVFASSTKQDLSEAREAVTWELLKLGFIPVGMENFSAQPDRGWKIIQRTIDQSDYYVVIVAGRYGSIDSETGKSWTQREYEYAREVGIPVRAFVRAMGHITGTELDDGDERMRLDAFRNTLSSLYLREEWTTIDDLRAQVGAALSKAVQEDAAEGTTRPGWYRGPAPSLTEFASLSAEVRDLRERLAAARANNKPLELLRTLKAGTPVHVTKPVSGWGWGERMHDDFRFHALDEGLNVVQLRAGRFDQIVNFPLDKVDTVYPVDELRFALTFRPF